MSARFCCLLIALVSLVLSGVHLLCIMRLHKTDSIDAKKAPLVVCTTSIIADAVLNIAGSNVQLVCLMGSGVDPHSYHARERDVHLLDQADVVLYHGLHLEGKMGELFSALELQQGRRMVAVTRALDRRSLRASSFESIYDPHIWHDVMLWRNVVHEITTVLKEIDTEHAELYQTSSDSYIKELDRLDDYIKDRFKSLPTERRILVTAHDAFGYFGKAYGFQVVGLQGISTEAEVGMKDVQRLITFLIENHVSAIFLESSVLPRALKAVQKGVFARGQEIRVIDELYSDSLGVPGIAASSYIGMMQHNVNTIFIALSDTLVEH